MSHDEKMLDLDSSRNFLGSELKIAVGASDYMMVKMTDLKRLLLLVDSELLFSMDADGITKTKSEANKCEAYMNAMMDCMDHCLRMLRPYDPNYKGWIVPPQKGIRAASKYTLRVPGV